MTPAQPAARERNRVAAAPLRPVRLAAPDCTVERRPDGALMIRARAQLGPYPDRITERLIHWAERTPDRVFMADRDPANGAWRSVTYAQTLAQVRAIGAALLQRGLSAERPIMILSGNDIEHALLGLAAVHVGIPHAPISPAYALVSTDFEKLRQIVKLLTPGLVFASDGVGSPRHGVVGWRRQCANLFARSPKSFEHGSRGDAGSSCRPGRRYQRGVARFRVHPVSPRGGRQDVFLDNDRRRERWLLAAADCRQFRRGIRGLGGREQHLVQQFGD